MVLWMKLGLVSVVAASRNGPWAHFANAFRLRARANAQLADMLAAYDLVLVQELVAPPYAGRFPDGSGSSGELSK